MSLRTSSAVASVARHPVRSVAAWVVRLPGAIRDLALFAALCSTVYVLTPLSTVHRLLLSGPKIAATASFTVLGTVYEVTSTPDTDTDTDRVVEVLAAGKVYRLRRVPPGELDVSAGGREAPSAVPAALPAATVPGDLSAAPESPTARPAASPGETP